MLEQIVQQDIFEDEEQVDFDMIENGVPKSENRNRWILLLKGLCNIIPGVKYKPSEIAA